MAGERIHARTNRFIDFNAIVLSVFSVILLIDGVGGKIGGKNSRIQWDSVGSSGNKKPRKALWLAGFSISPSLC
jgi:hypothetical protein